MSDPEQLRQKAAECRRHAEAAHRDTAVYLRMLAEDYEAAANKLEGKIPDPPES